MQWVGDGGRPAGYALYSEDSNSKPIFLQPMAFDPLLHIKAACEGNKKPAQEEMNHLSWDFRGPSTGNA